MHLQDRFTKRVSRILGEQIDEKTITREVAILVEKSDVEEELLQLQALTDNFFTIIKQTPPSKTPDLDDIFSTERTPVEKNVPCGRKLDFIAQDLSKKINILNSKINNHKSISSVLSFKEILEKMRELIALVE